MRAHLIPLLTVLILVPASRAESPSLQFGDRVVVSFPELPTRGDGRVIGFSLTLVQANVQSVSRIPPGWSLDLRVRPSWQTTISGSCPSFQTTLSSATELPSVTFKVLDLSQTGARFQLKAEVETVMPGGSIVRRGLTSADLILSPAVPD